MSAEHEPTTSDEKVQAATGKPWDEWFRLLDAWNAKGRPHKEIAAWLREEHEVAGWWAQEVAVQYERARGLREVGQRHDGTWAVSVRRTVATTAKTLEREFREARRRAAWLEDARLDAAIRAARRTFRASDSSMGRVLRWDLDDSDEGGRLEVTLSPTDDGRCTVSLEHTTLASADARDDLKTRWAAALDTLRDAHA